jgi:hypothetical protein
MKKIILGITMGLLLISCSSSSNDSSSPAGVFSWSFKLDGVQYQWSGSLTDPNSAGLAQYSGGNILLTKNLVATVGITLSSVSTGNFTCNSTSSSSINIGIVEGIQDLDTSRSGSNMNVNISSLSSDTFSTNPLNPGKVIGTFSGTIKDIAGDSHTVTDGSFEAIRFN